MTLTPETPKIDMRDVARSGHVTRWHAVRCGRPQTVAEHHYMVAQIVRDLIQNILGDKASPEDRLLALEYALDHDSPEFLMGDLPSPLKRRVEQICKELGIPNPLEIIEEQIAPDLALRRKEIKARPELAALLKLADLIDAILFISEEGIGRHAQRVCQELKDVFDQLVTHASWTLPWHNWSYAQTLLEQMQFGEANQIAFEMPWEMPAVEAAPAPAMP